MATSATHSIATRYKTLSLSWHHHHHHHHHHQYHHHYHFQRHRLDLCSDAKHCLHLFTSLQELMKTFGGKNLHDVDYSIMESPLSPSLSLVIYHFLSSCFRPFHLFLSPAYQNARLNARHSCFIFRRSWFNSQPGDRQYRLSVVVVSLSLIMRV